ncbi:hypothetical protein PT974_00312 [Cladobotryum mycophilum]|uniref:Uncharacterized protein n=1 Tax=Cladobotryum mycophilum TaxID=491253 RepID=A0ABR0T0Q4_9HYPO
MNVVGVGGGLQTQFQETPSLPHSSIFILQHSPLDNETLSISISSTPMDRGYTSHTVTRTFGRPSQGQIPSSSFSQHISIHQRCGACGMAMEPGDKMVALYRNDRKIEMLYASLFEKTNTCQPSYGEGIFCQQPSCLEKPELEESATVHTECLKLFARECNVGHKLQRLFAAATAIYPWRASAPLALPRHDFFRDSNIPFASDACGLPGLKTLPSELNEMIWRDAQEHIVWRYCHVVQLAKEMQAAQEEEPIILMMSEIHQWRRGGPPVLQDVPDHESSIRITMDSRGISSIERVSKEVLARQAGEPQDHTKRYIVRSVRSMIMIRAKFQFGLCRLLVAPTADVEIWDTPTPPDPFESNLTPYELPLHARLATINTDPRETTGLTFLFFNRLIAAIHVHTAAAPFAIDTRNACEFPGALTWVYLPLTPGDEIVSLGIRTPKSDVERTIDNASRLSYLALRKRKSGEVLIGVNFVRTAHEIMADTEPNPRLFYDTSFKEKVMFGAYPRAGELVRREVPLPRSPFRESFISTAPLGNVYKTQVFSERKTQKCMGIIFEYRDGSTRAIGQCRLGVDNVETCVEPTRLCYYATQFLKFPGMLDDQERFVNLRIDLQSILPHCPGYMIKCTSDEGGHEHRGDPGRVVRWREL